MSSNLHAPPAAPPTLSLSLSSSSTSSGTKKQKKTFPTYQRSVSQGSGHPSLLACRKATPVGWINLHLAF